MKSEQTVLLDLCHYGELGSASWTSIRDQLIRRLDQNLRESFPTADKLDLTPPAVTPTLELSSEEEITNRITSTLLSFTTEPPFTVQRVAELILYPNRHHRNKAKYLRALDRTLTVTSTTRDYPPADPNGTVSLTDQTSDFPLFSPIPWASAAIIPHERYSSPPSEITTYHVTNGIKGKETHDSNDDSTTQMSTGPPPPIDAVDIGIVSDDLARVAQEGGPPPRSPQDLNVSVKDKEEDKGAMDIE